MATQFATTELVEESFIFEWSLKDYIRMLEDMPDTGFVSPIFIGPGSKGHKWQLKILKLMAGTMRTDAQNHTFLQNENYHGIWLTLLAYKEGSSNSTIRNRVKGRAKISFQTMGGITIKEDSLAPTIFQPPSPNYSGAYGLQNFISHVNLLARLSPGDTLKVHCQIWIKTEVSHIFGEGDQDKLTAAEVIKKRRLEVATSLEDLRKDDQFVDVTIITSGKSFQAHKNILSVRSPVFCAMLSTEMVESAEGTIKILDFDEKTVEAMLDYIYTGQVENLQELAVDLVQIADKYDLVALKEDCEQSISDSLTLGNVLEVMVIANMFNTPRLKETVTKFYYQNEAELKKTEAFQKLIKSNPSIVAELYVAK